MAVAYMGKYVVQDLVGYGKNSGGFCHFRYRPVLCIERKAGMWTFDRSLDSLNEKLSQ